MPADPADHRQPRILIARLSAIGDCLQTLPLACALKRQFPQSHLTWLVEKAAAPLLETVSEIDRVLVAPKRVVRSPAGLWQLRQQLRAARFDLSFDPQSLTKSALLAWLAGAPRRIGFARPQGRELAPWLNNERIVCVQTHMVDRNLELLKPWGIQQTPVRFGLRIPPAAAEFARRLLGERPALQRGFAAINPGAGWDSKLWPIERYAPVARHLAGLGLTPLVVWGGKREQAWAEAIVTGARGAAMLAPSTSLVELAALLQRATLFIGSDTGPLHLAAAVGTPCVAMFGSSKAEVCGPYGNGHAMLQAAFDDSPGRKRPGADNWAMREITAPAVMEACERLLQRQGESAA